MNSVNSIDFFSTTWLTPSERRGMITKTDDYAESQPCDSGISHYPSTASIDGRILQSPNAIHSLFERFS